MDIVRLERVAERVDHVAAWRRGGGHVYGPWFTAEDLLEGEEDLSVRDVRAALSILFDARFLVCHVDPSGVTLYRERVRS